MSGQTRTCDTWLGYTSPGSRRELMRALQSVAPSAILGFVDDASELRESFLDEEPGTVGAIVGLSDQGVSDVNLAAALAMDGRAAEVVLVCRRASGSLRSRAARAGISQVIEVDGLRVREPFPDGQEPNQRGVRGRRKEVSSPSGKGERGLPPADREMPWRVDGQAEEGLAALDQTGPLASPVPAAQPQPQPYQSDTYARGRAPVIAFVSGRGGVGKTTLVASCAARAASWGMQVAIVDLDFSCGNLHSYFGARLKSDLAALSDGDMTTVRMGRAGEKVSDGVMLWGPCERPEDGDLFAPHVEELIKYLSSRFELVLIDCSSTFTEVVARAVRQADRVVLVGGQEADSLDSLARTNGLAVRLGVERTRIVRVENGANLKAAPPKLPTGAAVGLENAKLYRIADGTQDVRDLLGAGEVVSLACEDGAFGNSLGSLLAHLLYEMGRLPESDGAKHDLKVRVGRRKFSLFGRRKEEV